MHWRPASGIQSTNPQYKLDNKTVNAGSVTTFNEYAIVSENRLTKIPEEYSLESAILYGCAITTGFGAVENNANIKLGQSIVVVGAGGVGLSIVQGASLEGLYPIIAVDLFENRLELAKSLGATHTILNQGDDSLKKYIHDNLEASKLILLLITQEILM